MTRKFVFDFSHVPAALSAGAARLGEVAETGNTDLLRTSVWPFYAAVVRQWPFPGNPANPKHYERLTVAQFFELQFAAQQYVNAARAALAKGGE